MLAHWRVFGRDSLEIQNSTSREAHMYEDVGRTRGNILEWVQRYNGLLLHMLLVLVKV